LKADLTTQGKTQRKIFSEKSLQTRFKLETKSNLEELSEEEMSKLSNAALNQIQPKNEVPTF